MRWVVNSSLVTMLSLPTEHEIVYGRVGRGGGVGRDLGTGVGLGVPPTGAPEYQPRR